MDFLVEKIFKNQECELFLGDCIEIMDNLIDKDFKVDMIFTDPPYKMTARGGTGNTRGMFKKDIVRKGKVFKENNLEIEDWLPRFYKILNDNSHCYIMTNNKNISHYLKAINESKFHFIKCLIWVKDNKIVGNSYMNQYEYIIMLRKGKFRKLNNNGYSDVFHIPNKKQKNETGKNLHDTEKPIELTDILVKNSTNETDIVFDPFMGIGGCGVSCKKLNRKFVGIELDKKYFDIVKHRINNTTYD